MFQYAADPGILNEMFKKWLVRNPLTIPTLLEAYRQVSGASAFFEWVRQREKR
jgi:hypothetical protein